MMNAQYPLFAKRDLDGFFGLFVDNLVQLLLIVQFCSFCGITADSDLLLRYILPGAAVSILLGNIFYAWQAHRLAKREGRNDVTALPYGINTPSLLVYIFFVMQPVYQQTQDPELAWKMGLIACLGSGVIELVGAFFGGWIRRHTPRAALLSTLAGIAIGFISMTFALQIFQRPLIAMLPLAVILLTYFSRVGFPLGLPGGFAAVSLGTACAWILPMFVPESIIGPAMSVETARSSLSSAGLFAPQFVGSTILETLRDFQRWSGYLSVIVPMGLFNVIGSMQNVESAEAAGDRYDTQTSMAVNGVGTIVAALFGSCFPTTIYIGHPGWKRMGARAGYSTLNGLAVTVLCLTGTVGFVSNIIPLEAGIAIVLWIGIVITAQAFQATPDDHAPAVAVGLFPAIAAWGATVVMGAFNVIGFTSEGASTMQQLLEANLATEVNGFLLHGLLTMERGYIFTCMLLAGIAAFLIDRKFYVAALWSVFAAILAGLGLTHAYQLSGNNLDFLFVFQSAREGHFVFRPVGIVAGYLMFAVMFAVFGWRYRQPVMADQTAAETLSPENGDESGTA